MQEDTIMVVSNMPDGETARTIAHELVGMQLAACVNILPPVQSVYRWQGAVEEATEVTVLIKTRRDCYDELQAAILRLHPYELPEIIVLPIDGGLPDYLAWIVACTSAAG